MSSTGAAMRLIVVWRPTSALACNSVTQFDLDPDQYMAEIRAELPRYDELEDAVARATQGVDARRVLELGVGVGETAERVLAAQPRATLTGIDRSAEMVERARAACPTNVSTSLRARGSKIRCRAVSLSWSSRRSWCTTLRRRTSGICSGALRRFWSRARDSCWVTSSCLSSRKMR